MLAQEWCDLDRQAKVYIDQGLIGFEQGGLLEVSHIYLLKKWVKANKLEMLIIRVSVDQTIRRGILICKTAKDLLETIKKKFEGSV